MTINNYLFFSWVFSREFEPITFKIAPIWNENTLVTLQEADAISFQAFFTILALAKFVFIE